MLTGSVVGYCRYSSSNQREESISAQKRFILGYAQSNSLTVDKWYIDEAFSGKTDKRPAFLEMIEAAKAGKIRKVIVHKLDRFSRSMADTVNYRGMFRDLDVELISVAEDFEHTPAGNLMTTMIAAFNQYYVENLATEVMKGMTETAIQGMWTGGKPPLGYDVDEEQRLVLNPQEAAVVRTIFEMIAAGYGYARIANTLNEAGYKTKAGKPFVTNSIHDLLDNEKYIGRLIFNRRASVTHDGKYNSHKYKPREKWIEYPGGCPAIVPLELWNRVQTLRRLHISGRHKAKHPYLLSGRVHCSNCGGSMYGSTWDKRALGLWRSYYCANHKRYRSCDVPMLSADAMEGYVLQVIESDLLGEGCVQIIVDAVNQKIREAQVDNRELLLARENLNRLNSEKKNLTETIARIGYEDVLGEHLEYIRSETEAYETRIRQLEEKSAQCRITPDEAIRQLETIFAELHHDRHISGAQSLIAFLVDSISIGTDIIAVNIAVEFTLADEDHTRVRYERTHVTRRKEIIAAYPSSWNADEWAPLRRLWLLRSKYFPALGEKLPIIPKA